MDATFYQQMLLQRLDVTVQALLWSDRVQDSLSEVDADMKQRRAALTAEPGLIEVADALTAGPEAVRDVGGQLRLCVCVDELTVFLTHSIVCLGASCCATDGG